MLYSNKNPVKKLKFNQQNCPVLANAFYDLWGPLLVKPQFQPPELLFFTSIHSSKIELWQIEFLQQDIVTKYTQKRGETSPSSSGFRLCACS